MKNISVSLILTMLPLMGCSTASESDLVSTINDKDENEVVTYNDDIRNIINNNCIGCHSSPPINGAPFSLTTYSQVKVRAENGTLLTAISKQTGETSAMPPTGRLPQATILLVEQWIANGLLED